MADQNREDRIRRRAHEIWEMEGRPVGADERHWMLAVAEVDATEPPAAKKAPKAPKASAAKKAPSPKAAASKAAPTKAAGARAAKSTKA